MINFLLLAAIAAILLFGASSAFTSLENLIIFIISNIYYIISLLLFVTVCIMILFYAKKQKLTEDMIRKFLVILLMLSLLTIFVIPYLAGKFFNTYKVKLKLTLYNPLFGNVKISSFEVDYSSMQKYYSPISSNKASLFGDSVDISIVTKCYLNNVEVYYYTWKGYTDVSELSSKTIDVWLYNIPAGSFCKSTAIVTSGKYFNTKTITFSVPS